MPICRRVIAAAPCYAMPCRRYAAFSPRLLAIIFRFAMLFVFHAIFIERAIFRRRRCFPPAPDAMPCAEMLRLRRHAHAIVIARLPYTRRAFRLLLLFRLRAYATLTLLLLPLMLRRAHA